MLETRCPRRHVPDVRRPVTGRPGPEACQVSFHQFWNSTHPRVRLSARTALGTVCVIPERDLRQQLLPRCDQNSLVEWRQIWSSVTCQDMDCFSPEVCHKMEHRTSSFTLAAVSRPMTSCSNSRIPL